MLVTSLNRIITHPAAGSILLFASAFSAIIMVNIGDSAMYNAIIYFPAHSDKSDIISHLSLIKIINDGLMAIFFLVVGLEVKYELLKGALNSRNMAVLPAIAAVGGMIMPVVIYSIVTAKEPMLHVGWGIPIATDISFAIGVINLLGTRVPDNLKVFLLALAIIDDLGSILIIALFYNNSKIDLFALIAAVSIIIIMVLMNIANIRFLSLYLLLGAILWVFILFSGIHATLAGVIIGGIIPITLPSTQISPAFELKNRLQPWIVYFILPLFAFANTGISLHQSISHNNLISLLPLGIAAGLLFGKPLGIMLFTAAAMRFGLAKLPNNIDFRHIAAVGILCGIGFTMSIFIANLAFSNANSEIIIQAKIGILSGSVCAAIVGYLLLRFIFSSN